MDRCRPSRRAFAALAGATCSLLAWPLAVGATTSVLASPPAGWTTLIDDTELLSLVVPPDWDDVSTAPADGPDGTAVPTIVASTDIDAMRQSPTRPGVTYQAIPYDSDVGARLAAAAPEGCAEERTALYDDGAFNGVIRHASGCDAGPEVEVATVVASPADRSLTIVLVASAPAGDRDVITGLIAGFNLTPRDNPADTVATTILPETTTTVLAATTTAPVTTTTIPTTTTTGPATTTTIPGGQVEPLTPTTTGAPTTGPSTTDPGVATVTIVDDTGAISLAAPAAWDDVDPAPDFADGQQIPYIEASTDRAEFLTDDSYSVPGVLYRAAPYIADTRAELATYSETNCDDGGIAQYADGVFTGHLRTYTGCGSTGARMYLLMASPADHSFTAIVIVQLLDSGAAAEAELHAVLDSFNYDPAVMATFPFAATTATTTTSTTTTSTTATPPIANA